MLPSDRRPARTDLRFLLLGRWAFLGTSAELQSDLRPKEFALLAVLATHPGRVFSRGELVDLVWGAAYAGGPRTVDVHIRWLRAKIGEDPARPVHVITVRGTGCRLDPPE